jgi:hypothetical protein
MRRSLDQTYRQHCAGQPTPGSCQRTLMPDIFSETDVSVAAAAALLLEHNRQAC